MDSGSKERFWAKVDRSRGAAECWEWTACRVNGYGRFGFARRPLLAHRVAWEVVHGPLADPEDCVLHRCDNRACCNPAHLFIGTRSDNLADMFAKGRGAPQDGERNARARLSREQVAEIRTRYARGGVTQRALADLFGVGKTTVGSVINRTTWDY
ncbi:MAG: HNH endonuclease [Thermoleophilia bacterium]